MLRRILLSLLSLLIGLPPCAYGAARFWVGGDGIWDNSSTTHWSTVSGGISGTAAPTSVDNVTFDGNSGAGTGLGGGAKVTPNADVTAQDVALGTTGGQFTGSLLFSTNNNSPTFRTFAFSGTGLRQLDLGNGTWTLTSGGGNNAWDLTTTTSLTFNANSSTLNFVSVSTPVNVRSFIGGGKIYNIVNLYDTNNSGFLFQISVAGAANNTFSQLNLIPPLALGLPQGGSFTISSAFNWIGTLSNPIVIDSNAEVTGPGTIHAVNGGTIDYGSLKFVTFDTGPVTATHSIGNKTLGVTITQSSGGGGSPIIGQ